MPLMNPAGTEHSPLVRNIEATVRRYRLLPRGTVVGVAVSGGADSVAMLVALAALAHQWKWRLVVLHVNHGIRGRESGDDARFVRRFAKRLGFPAYVEKLPRFRIPADGQPVSEDALRKKRYEALGDLARKAGASVVAVGHHRDDQAETVLMNFLRGAGPAGLGGIRPRAEVFGVKVVRPLFDCTRAEIVAFCRSAGVGWREDSSNRDVQWLRNRIRRCLMPALESDYNPQLRDRLADNARWFREDDDYLERLAREALWPKGEGRRAPRSIPRARLAELEPPILARLFRLWIRAVSGAATPPTGRQIVELIDLACTKRAGRREVRCSGDIVFFVSGEDFTWRKVPGRRRSAAGSVENAEGGSNREEPPLFELPGDGLPVAKNSTTVIRTGRGQAAATIELRRWNRKRQPRSFQKTMQTALSTTTPHGLEQYFDADKLEGTLVLRNRRAGDRFHPLGARGGRKLKDFLIDRKIPAPIRSRLLLLCDENRVLWLAGIQTAHFPRLTERTENILRIRVMATRP